MEPAGLILDYIRVLIWPASLLTIVLIFRKPILRILAHIKTLNLPGGFALDFDQEIADGQRVAKQIKAPAPPPQHASTPSIPLTEANARMLSLGLRPSPSGLDFRYYRDLAARDANVSLAGLRIEFELLTKNLARGFNIEIGKRESVGVVLRKLRENHAITEEQHELGTTVLRLCNAAVHGRPVTQEEAESVLDLAEVLSAQYVAWLSWGFPDGWEPRQGHE